MTVEVQFRLSDDRLARVGDILRSRGVDPGEGTEVLHALTGAILRLGVDPVQDHEALESLLDGILQVRARIPRAKGGSQRSGAGEVDERRVLEDFRSRLSRLLELQDRERSIVDELMQEIQRQPQARRRWLVRNSRRFQSHGLAEHLLETTQELWHEDPEEAERLAGVALEVCERLDEGVYGASMVHDLRARSFSHLANSRRVLGLVRSVGEIFDAAEYHFRQGSGDPGQWALYYFLLSHLKVDERKFSQARELIDQASILYEAVGDLQDKARTLLHQSYVAELSSDSTTESLDILERVLKLTRNREPRFYFYAYHNITHRLWALGRRSQALERIETDRELARDCGGAIDLLKVDWLEGLILVDAGGQEEAETCLHRAMEGFLDHRMAIAGIGAGLNLVRLYLLQERSEKARELIPAMLGRAHDVYQGVLAALVTLQKALREEAATVELVDEISEFLEEAEVNPSARFESSTAA